MLSCCYIMKNIFSFTRTLFIFFFFFVKPREAANQLLLLLFFLLRFLSRIELCRREAHWLNECLEWKTVHRTGQLRTGEIDSARTVVSKFHFITAVWARNLNKTEGALSKSRASFFLSIEIRIRMLLEEKREWPSFQCCLSSPSPSSSFSYSCVSQPLAFCCRVALAAGRIKFQSSFAAGSGEVSGFSRVAPEWQAGDTKQRWNQQPVGLVAVFNLGQ